MFVEIPSKLPIPDYGKSVEEYGLLGSVVVEFRLDENGTVAISSMLGPLVPCSNLESSLPEKIRNAVRKAVEKIKFSPILTDGKPVRTGKLLEFRFDPSAGKEGEDPNRPVLDFKTFGTLNDRALKLPDPGFPATGNIYEETVALTALVSESGSVAAVLPRFGPLKLHHAAMEAACKATFLQALVSDRPVRSFGQIVYRVPK